MIKKYIINRHCGNRRKINKVIHGNGSVVFAQLWHLGRVVHPLHQSGQPAYGPSPVAAEGGKFRYLAPSAEGYLC